MQSGACIGATAPLDVSHEHHRTKFAGLTKAMRLDNVKGHEKIEKLRAVHWKHLMSAMEHLDNPDGMFCLTADDNLRDGFWKPCQPATDTKLIIGNTRHDVSHKRTLLM